MIKGIFCDVDGVLTDAGYYCTESGLEMKKFNTRDAAASHRLKEAGIYLFIVTSCNNAITKTRMKAYSTTWESYGVKDKLATVEDICGEWGLGLDEVVYIGDDAMDVSVMEKVAIAVCPCNATDAALRAADVICDSKGGEGTLAEVIDWVINAGPIGCI